jgi:LysM repeat protein
MKLYKHSLLLGLVLVFTSITITSAQSRHTVKSKETLYSISKKYSLTIDQLKKWNRLQSNSIAIGQVLLITDPFLKAKEENAKKNKFKAETHIVKKSETLFAIAKEYDVSLKDLRDLNNIKKNEVKVGQELIIRYVPNNDNLITQTESRKSLNIETFETIEVAEDISIKEFAIQNNSLSEEISVLNPFLKGGQLIKKGNKIVVLKSKGIINDNPYKIINTQNSNTFSDSSIVNNKEFITAFVYNEKEEGSVTTNGELINLNSNTIAHPTLPFGTLVLLKNEINNLVILARVNDRTTENAIKITEFIKKAIDYKPMAQMKISVQSL